MAKKQVRLKIDQLPHYLNPKDPISFVLKNGSVFLIRPVSIEGDNLKGKDRMGQTMTIPLRQIEDIWEEVKAS